MPGRAAGKGRAGDTGVSGARGDSGGAAAVGAEPMGMSREERGVEPSAVGGRGGVAAGRG